MAHAEWVNWSGSLRFTPAEIKMPEDEEALAALVRCARDEGRQVRALGAGHSSTPLVETDDTLVSLAHFTGVAAQDEARKEATVGAGSRLEDASRELLGHGLMLHNFGDVAMQTAAGVLATGTHGTGRGMQNLSAVLTGGRLVTGTGEIVECSFEEDSGLLRALRVSLGVLGIFTQVRLRLVEAYRITRREYCTDVASMLAHLDELAAGNRNFDFYWYPRSDEVKLRLLNHPGEGPEALPYARLVEERTGWGSDIIPKHTGIELKFDEMEYALPAEVGPECFQAIRERIKHKHRQYVGWRVLYRIVAADDTYLSPAYGQQVVTISLHQNAGLPFWGYFTDIEPIFRHYGGRPHWAKKHTLRAAELRPLYPEWDRFLAVRRRLDPDGVFLTPYLRALLGVEPSGQPV